MVAPTGPALNSRDLGLQDLEDEPLDVLDLPQIHSRPSAKALLDTLKLLSIESRSWDATPPRTPGQSTPQGHSGSRTPLERGKRRVKAEGVPQYLTNIVSSHLGWIDDDAEREEIWDTASVRLSERSGRTARGAFSRPFTIPLWKEIVPSAGQDPANEAGEVAVAVPYADILIHEPALTGDDLGLKTWAAAYVVARMWPTLLAEIPALQGCLKGSEGNAALLELGAGTGLVGIAAACALGARVLLTDLPAITTNLKQNVDQNATLIDSRGGQARVAVLDWTRPSLVKYNDFTPHLVTRNSADETVSQREGSLQAPVIVAADPVYSTEHPALLVDAVQCHLAEDHGATLIIALPMRDAYAGERQDLWQRLANIGLRLMLEKSEIGFDDWSDGRDDEPVEVRCSITIWRRG